MITRVHKGSLTVTYPQNINMWLILQFWYPRVGSLIPLLMLNIDTMHSPIYWSIIGCNHGHYPHVLQRVLEISILQICTHNLKCYRPTPCHIDMSAMRDRSWSMWSFTIWFFFSTSCSIIVSQKGLPPLNLADLFHFPLTSERGLFFLTKTLWYASRIVFEQSNFQNPLYSLLLTMFTSCKLEISLQLTGETYFSEAVHTLLKVI